MSSLHFRTLARIELNFENKNSKIEPDLHPSKANVVISGHFRGTTSTSSWVLRPNLEVVFQKKREKKKFHHQRNKSSIQYLNTSFA